MNVARIILHWLSRLTLHNKENVLAKTPVLNKFLIIYQETITVQCLKFDLRLVCHYEEPLFGLLG